MLNSKVVVQIGLKPRLYVQREEQKTKTQKKLAVFSFSFSLSLLRNLISILAVQARLIKQTKLSTALYVRKFEMGKEKVKMETRKSQSCCPTLVLYDV